MKKLIILTSFLLTPLLGIAGEVSLNSPINCWKNIGNKTGIHFKLDRNTFRSPKNNKLIDGLLLEVIDWGEDGRNYNIFTQTQFATKNRRLKDSSQVDVFHKYKAKTKNETITLSYTMKSLWGAKKVEETTFFLDTKTKKASLNFYSASNFEEEDKTVKYQLECE